MKLKEASSYSSNLRIHSGFLSKNFVPDGDLGKRVWREAERVRFKGDWSGREIPPEAETRVASLWSDTHVYFAFWCKYFALNVYKGEGRRHKRWGLWNRDVVEVFLNPQPERVNHYYEFEVAPDNQWIDLEIDLDKKPFNNAGWASRFEHATRINSRNRAWTCEMRIPFESMNVREVRRDAEWRGNFYRADGPGENTQRRLLCWSPVFGEKPNFHVPTRFGIIKFQRK